MKGWIGPIALCAVASVAAHVATLSFTPSVIMDQAMATLAKRNVAMHGFSTQGRVTPATQTVVRSSPDLFYALCRYDLSGPDAVLEVKMGEWPGYQSLSFFDAETNNFATLRGEGKAIDVTLRAPGNAITDGLESPTTRGVVLIRRLAPSQELFDLAMEAAKGDGCELLSPPSAA